MAADCLFCKIVAGDVPATMVHEDAQVVAFRDVDPQAPTHLLVIPREHYADAGAMAAADGDLLAAVLRVATEVAAAEGLDESGYRLVANKGPDGGQTVFHAHVHVLGGRPLSWPPG
jgi:histidine triad (HIT) family protein